MSKIIIVLSVITLLLTGCGSNEIINPEPSGEIVDTPEIISGEVVTVNPGDDFEILKLMMDTENYMVSPFSLKMAMMLAANGATGETKQEIIDAFSVGDVKGYNEKAKNLIKKYSETQNVKLEVANSIWLNTDIAGEGVNFSEAYKKLIEEFYFGIAGEDGANKIASKINSWIAKKTNNKIKDMLDTKTPADFMAVLVNTIYFKGEWAEQFEKRATTKETFTSRDNTKKEIDFMHMTKHYEYYEDDNMKMVRVPYKGNDLAMYFVLAKNEEKMNIKSALNNMTSYKVKLSIPKFKTEYNLSFKEALHAMGVSKAFDEWGAEFKDAMFDNVKDDENVYVDDVLQKTFIEVDENGTEAAAATAVVMEEATGMMPVEEEIKEFKADKPFIYFIMDEETHEVLFIGEQAYEK